ncbi:MAG: TetR/AcrR family transcriptional regulator [Pseudomonadota bacterium]
MSQDWERARNPAQKAVRRDAILDAARTLFAELEYDEISLNAIAREAGISKPNVYRYFSTREEIYLAIFEEERDRFAEDFAQRLKRSRIKDPIERVSRVWVAASLASRTWMDLVPLIAISLERNSSIEQIVQFKTAGRACFGKLTDHLHDSMPVLSEAEWLLIVQCVFAFMAGLWPLANPSSRVQEAMAHPDVDEAPWQFDEMFERGVTAMIRGTLDAKRHG